MDIGWWTHHHTFLTAEDISAGSIYGWKCRAIWSRLIQCARWAMLTDGRDSDASKCVWKIAKFLRSLQISVWLNFQIWVLPVPLSIPIHYAISYNILKQETQTLRTYEIIFTILFLPSWNKTIYPYRPTKPKVLLRLCNLMRHK